MVRKQALLQAKLPRLGFAREDSLKAIYLIERKTNLEQTVRLSFPFRSVLIGLDRVTL